MGCDSLHWLPYQFKHGVLPINMLEQQSGSKIKIKEIINTNNGHMMFGNEVRTILFTFPTAEQLQFPCQNLRPWHKLAYFLSTS